MTVYNHKLIQFSTLRVKFFLVYTSPNLVSSHFSQCCILRFFFIFYFITHYPLQFGKYFTHCSSAHQLMRILFIFNCFNPYESTKLLIPYQRHNFSKQVFGGLIKIYSASFVSCIVFFSDMCVRVRARARLRSSFLQALNDSCNELLADDSQVI